MEYHFCISLDGHSFWITDLSFLKLNIMLVLQLLFHYSLCGYHVILTDFFSWNLINNAVLRNGNIDWITSPVNIDFTTIEHLPTGV